MLLMPVTLSTNYTKMIEASREALYAAINVTVAGGNVGIIGHAVQDTIEKYGYRPIANLTGHRIKRYNLHSGVSIPSVRERGGPTLNYGDIVAFEPFDLSFSDSLTITISYEEEAPSLNRGNSSSSDYCNNDGICDIY